MWRSARRSRWPVVTPGFSSASTRAKTSATIRPAWRIFSISRRDLRVTMSGSLRGGVRGPDHVAGHVLDRLAAVDRDEHASFAVMVDHVRERRQLLGHPGPDGRLLVVGPLDQLGAVEVADQIALRRVREQVVHVAVRLADAAVGHPDRKSVV